MLHDPAEALAFVGRRGMVPHNMEQSGYRAWCPQCRRALSACWCSHVVPAQTAPQVVVLQHPRESRNPIGTARMAHLALPGSHLLVGLRFEEDARFQQLWQRQDTTHVVLYPGPHARDAAELVHHQGPLTVWALDGTWWQARKLWQLNPQLHSLPRYQLNPTQPGQYRIRKEPEAHCLSTVEALVNLLDTLNGTPGQHTELLAPFHAMVQHQVDWSNNPARVPRVRRKRNVVHRPALPPHLRQDPAKVVLVYGEGNGWPSRLKDAPPVELLQWLAVRPATGEHFHAFVQPVHELSPHALQHQELTDQDLTSAVDHAQFRQRWQDFIHPDDIFCSWGHFSFKVLKSTGAPLPQYTDLRPICSGFKKESVGPLEHAYEVFGEPPISVLHPGRGGRRMAQMLAMFRVLANA